MPAHCNVPTDNSTAGLCARHAVRNTDECICCGKGDTMWPFAKLLQTLVCTLHKFLHINNAIFTCVRQTILQMKLLLFYYNSLCSHILFSLLLYNAACIACQLLRCIDNLKKYNSNDSVLPFHLEISNSLPEYTSRNLLDATEP